MDVNPGQLVPTVDGWDAISSNLWAVPAGQGAGYTTGPDWLKWSAANWRTYPDAVRICQDAGATDTTADVLDVERGAATPAEAPAWYEAAFESYKAGKRKGQRHPAIYCSPSVLPALSEAFRAAGIRGEPWIYLAHWGIGLGGARAQLQTDLGPFHLIGLQFANGKRFDSDVWSFAWLTTRAGNGDSHPAPAPEAWTEQMMKQLPALKQGDSGAAVRTLQGLLVARHYRLGTTGSTGDGIDGNFGALTDSAVRDLQGKAGIAADGIAGPHTWPVLAGV